MVHNRLYMFLEQNNAFCNYQFGFRNNHSINYAVIEITKEIRNACDKNLFDCRVYHDLQKAFDAVNHEIFLSKLKHYRIEETSHNWFRPFLCERMWYTLIKESELPLKQYLMVCHKALYLDLFYLSSSLKTCTIQLNIVNYINMRMTQTCF